MLELKTSTSSYGLHTSETKCLLYLKKVKKVTKSSFLVINSSPLVIGLSRLESKDEYEYTFERASGVVATVSKKWALVADTYGVDIIPGEDDVLILACTVVIETASD